MSMNVHDIVKLVSEVARHKKKARLVLDYDGEKFHPMFERIVLTAEEYTMLGERKTENGGDRRT